MGVSLRAELPELGTCGRAQHAPHWLAVTLWMSGPASRVDDVGLGNLVRTIVKDGWAPPQLLRALRQLIVDFLAVWTGVRPTFMIDYCRGTAESWWEVLVQLAEHFGLPGDGLANLAVLTLDDCCYVADRRALRSHLSLYA